jgi:C4-type Zn-finger protein
MAYKIQPQTRSPRQCPMCLRTTVIVRMAGTVLHQPSIIRLTVRCDTCQHQWVVDAVGEPPELDAPLHRLQDNQYH